jgi:hypothetical protein
MNKSAVFQHLIKHYRTHKKAMALELTAGKQHNIATALGALDCLYWQALGNGLTNLAKGIGRTIMYSYQYHPIRLASQPQQRNKEAA